VNISPDLLWRCRLENLERLARSLSVDMSDRATWRVEGLFAWREVLARRVSLTIEITRARDAIARRKAAA